MDSMSALFSARHRPPSRTQNQAGHIMRPSRAAIELSPTRTIRAPFASVLGLLAGMAEGEDEKIVAGAGGGDEEKKAIVVAGAGDDEEKAIVLAGAGDEEEKAVVLVGAGGDEEEKQESAAGGGNGAWFTPPPGFRFTPGEGELVIYYLLPKLQGREHVPNHSIIEAYVYESHPDVLTATHKKRGGESWYFLSPRARKYRNGRRPSRSTEDRLGRWKASTSSKEGDVKLAGDGKTKYSLCTLNYYEGKIKGETKSKWIMKEITIPEYENEKGAGGDGDKDVLDEYVMCRIYLTPRPKSRQCKVVEEDEAGPSGTQSEPPEESGQAGATNLSEKQAGKRPAEDQTLRNAATCTAPKRARHPNPDRLHLGPPAAPLHAGNGMQGPFMAPMGCYGGGPGHPMGYHARPPMPQPPMVYNNVQAPVAHNNRQVHASRQQMGYNGQSVPPPRQQPQVAYNGQGPLPRQQAGFSGQGPRAAYNGQVMRALSPPYWPGDSYGQIQNQAMATRPPCPPAGQAVNPPSSVVPRPAQTQKQPETEEMRYHRVIQQNLREFHRISQGAMPPSPGAALAAHRQRSTTQQQQPPTAFPQQQQQRQIMQQQPPTASTQEQQQQTASTQQQQQPPPAFTQEHHLRMMQFMQHHGRMMQPQQQPYNFGANGNYHRHAGAMAPQFSLDNFNASEAAQHYHNQRGRVLPSAMSSSSGTSGVVSGAGGGEVTGANPDCNNGGTMELVGSTTVGGSPSAADGNAPKHDSAQ
ncbi:hypothetical protein QYE76_024969 [Lolium multiflorum]|uniref:NAC domain-containing protein n=1 Tax=Lolium multiflorum TaxID=4521 RepID=A0AAD8RG05_LOLMU|nr:hypothetical protein QYE76_024969 [Lolium multiflorum]